MNGEVQRVLKVVQCVGAAALVAGFMGAAMSVAAAQQGDGITTETSQRVTVFRGQPTFTAKDLSAEADKPAQGLEPVIGYDGWFIDRANNRLVNCYRIDGTQVGQRRIKCISKRL
jgi:hypothetical protein